MIFFFRNNAIFNSEINGVDQYVRFQTVKNNPLYFKYIDISFHLKNK